MVVRKAVDDPAKFEIQMIGAVSQFQVEKETRG
jgi:hypothetical protein